MKYVGSKAGIAKELSAIINKVIETEGIETYIEPFVGGANLIQHINCKYKIGMDNNKYLIAFWKRIQEGWNPLEEVEMTKELYYEIKSNMDSFPRELVALAGFCASYNSKWFGGYADITLTKIGTFRNYYEEAVRNVLKQREYIKDVKFMYCNYNSYKTVGALIYCDPPYAGKTGYKDPFDNYKFWNWVRKTSKQNIVLCSELDAPSDFVEIWSKDKTVTVDNGSRKKVQERLFKYKC